MRFKLYFYMFLLLPVIAKAQFIQIDESYTAQQLVSDVLMNSDCIPASNFSVSGGVFNDNSKSYAYFTNTSPDFPFQNGIILSSGKASSAIGPNSYHSDDGDPFWLGDLELEEALNISLTYNSTVLEFDFIPQTDIIRFDYIFASEEYVDEMQCDYSDGFAFLIKKVNDTAPYQNLAVIPGTNTPVKVTTIHPNVPGHCGAVNPSYFGSYNPINYPTNFNGQTKIMTAQSAVDRGELYHIKLVIADQSDFSYDSAIFLKANSFGFGPDFGPNRLIATGNPVCQGESLLLNGALSGSNTYQWFKNNVLLPGETNPTYLVNSPGTYKVEVFLNGLCTTSGQIDIEYSTITTTNATIIECDDNNDGITTFNLTNVSQIITGGNPDLTITGYFSNLFDAQNELNQLQNPLAFQNAPAQNSVIAKVKDQFGCFAYTTITLQIPNNPMTQTGPIETCDLDTTLDGYYQFDLDTVSQNIRNNNPGLPSGVSFQYYASSQDAVSSSNPLPTNYPNTIAYEQIIYARITDGYECYQILPITLIVNVLTPENFNDETVYLCEGSSLVLDPGSNFTTYAWDTNPLQTSQTITVTQPGVYHVTVSDNNGCLATKKYTVTSSAPAIIIDIVENNFQGNQNSITVYVQGIGDYEFSLDNINYQDSNFFTNLNPEIYTIYVRDKHNCGYTTGIAYVLDYPKFFTPNGDQYNDTWKIKNLEINFPNSVMYIFDRYGKLMKQFNPSKEGWDGTYLNKPLPATDYWFELRLNDGRTIKGHFALKR
ncbi:MAG TPA: choice-of-anchor L domain-containing protein [Flavobacterium sp.]|uniref:choice-of-anchor L domain-containing protein n=1 Tax=Flavobacterium sp. TaxID=239 RepID=UPI002BF79B18|nr:choice-of-anchor L domain-containing protein [Flavobacterium sp.]HSD13689.1 choice-of-anchor L domain-containing protein [Flavobacterium sp.]